MARLWSNRTPALTVSRSPIVRASLANAAAVTNTAAVVGRRGGDRLKRLPVVIDESDTARNDSRAVVLASFDLRADLPLVIGAKESRPIVAERRLDRRADERQRRRTVSGAPLVTPVTRSNRLRHRRIAVTRVVQSRVDEPSDAHIPQGVRRQGMRQIAEGHCGNRGVQAQGRLERRHERRAVRVDPEFVVNALHQLQARLESPRELREDLVLLVGSRERRVRAWLTVVVAQVLVSGEEPESLAHNRTAEVRREVAVSWPARSRLATGDPVTGSRTGWLVRPDVCP